MRISSLNSFLPAVLGAASIAIVCSAFSSPANAYSVSPKADLVTVDGQNDTGRRLDPVKYLVPANQTKPSVPLSAKADITIDALTDSLLSLTINIANTTDPSFQSSIVSFGFGLLQEVKSVDVIGGDGKFTALYQNDKQQTFPGGFKQIDICIFAANGCSGGNINQGLLAGQSSTIKLNINGNFGSKREATMTDFPIKFQTQDGSYEVAGVPEPITVVGSGLALGFGTLFKKQVSKRRKKEVVKA